MSIFDDALDTAKKVFSTVEKETVKTASVSKLKVKALRLNAALTDSFAELGKHYYQTLSRAGEVPADLTRLVSEIKYNQDQLQSVKDEIIALKGGTVCSECGTVNLDGAEYCSHCGKEL